MTEHRMVQFEGAPIRLGETVKVDHYVQEFKIVVRSMHGVHDGMIKELIQQKFEVVKCEEVACTAYVVRP